MKKQRQQTICRFFRDGYFYCSKQGEIFRPGRNKPLVGSSNRGYRMATLSASGEKLSVCIHQAIWIFFNGGFPEWLEINHKDGNKGNNRLENLELVSHAENMDHASRAGLIQDRGESHPKAKLNSSKVKNIRDEYATGTHTLGTLASKYGVSDSTISNIVLRITWRHL